MKTLVWHGCYEKSLSGFIVPEAFSHPAKYSLSLIERVFDHMIESGWIWSGGNYKVDAVIRAHCVEELACKRIPMGDTIPQCQLDTSRKDTYQQTNSQSEPLPYESTVETNRAHGSRSQSRTHGSLDPQLFGPSTEEQSLKDLSCTTGMKTPSMTTLQTSPSSSGPDTQKCTEKPSKSRGKNKSTNSKMFSAPNAQPFSKGKSSTETAFATNAESNPEGPQDFVTSKGFVVQNNQPPKIGETIFRVSCEIGDPFGGVGVGGLVAAYRRLNWVGVELEPRFVSIAQQNFEFHRDRLRVLGTPMPRIIQGDSRQFARRVQGVVTSPPYAQSLRGLNHNGIDPAKLDPAKHHTGQSSMLHQKQSYGSSPGQIEKLPGGDLSSVVTSPPFSPSVKGGGGINKKGYTSRPDLGPDWVGNRSFQGAGAERDPSNIEKLSEGSIDSVISSPPYAETLNHGGGPDTDKDKTRGGGSLLAMKKGYGATEGQIGALKAVVASPPYAAISAGAGGLNTKPAKKPGQQGGRSAVSASQTADQKYGRTEGQISQLSAIATSPPYGDTQVAQSPDEKRVGWRGYTNAEGGKKGEAKNRIDCLPMRNTGRGETYWDAMHTVYAQCFAAIRPGGHIAIVVKDYCKDGKVIPLCDDTARLLEHVGFKVVERAHAMLVNETTEGDLFNGTQTKRRERKSFFRRLYESKGGPRIDFEVVLFAQKPCKTG